MRKAILSREIALRFLSGLILGTIGAITLYFGGLPFAAFCAAIGGIMVWETARLANPDIDWRSTTSLGTVAMIVTTFGFLFGTNYLLMVALLALVLILGIGLVQRNHLKFLGFALAILLAVQALFWVRSEFGLLTALWLIIIVVATDVGGFFFGRALGGPKLIAAISPQKTWSGAIGGWGCAVLVGLVFQLIDSNISLLSSLVVSMASQAGDIAESWFKRTAGVKDSSSLLPGHGGFFDRFDGMVGGALCFWILYQLSTITSSEAFPQL